MPHSKTESQVWRQKGITGKGGANPGSKNVTEMGSNPAGSEGSKSPGPEKGKPPVIHNRRI